MQVVKALVMIAALALSACGPTHEEESGARLASDPATSLYIAVGPQTGNSYAIMLSAPAGYERAVMCLGHVATCTETQSGNYKFTKTTAAGGRVFFQSSITVQIVHGGQITVAAYNAAGAPLLRKVLFYSKQGGTSPTGGVNWKVVLMASDQGNQGSWIDAFDNARKTLKTIFLEKRVPEQNFRELSLKPKHQSATVKPTNLANFAASLKELQPNGANDACIVHMTSHGARNGFCLGNARLAPADLDAALNQSCGDKPTVVLVSACYSGLYTLDSSGLKKPNRIIMTAASADKTSFGCSPENEYTYWDGCLIDNLRQANTWAELADKVKACIVRKEGGSSKSNPQSFIGAQVQNLALPR